MRVVYPFSVVPGGVKSVEELKNAIASDAVVSTDYAAFDLSNARIIRLDRDRSVHVSYRLGSQVYWTKEELKLDKGETLITDGVHMALTKSGNMISESVSEPVLLNEPTVQEMDTPLDPQVTDIQTASNVPPDIPVTQIPGINMPPIEIAPPPPLIENDPGILLPPGPPGVPSWPAPPLPTHVVSVPEPRTVVLLLIGFIVLVLLRRRGAHRSHQHVG